MSFVFGQYLAGQVDFRDSCSSSPLQLNTHSTPGEPKGDYTIHDHRAN